MLKRLSYSYQKNVASLFQTMEAQLILSLTDLGTYTEQITASNMITIKALVTIVKAVAY
jgi:hypothetical protein